MISMANAMHSHSWKILEDWGKNEDDDEDEDEDEEDEDEDEEENKGEEDWGVYRSKAIGGDKQVEEQESGKEKMKQ